MKRKRTSSPARSAMKLLCFLLGVIFFVMLGATVYFQQLLGNMPYNDSPASLSWESLGSFFSSHSLNLDGGLFDSHDSRIGGRGSPIVNILLIGQDRREGEDRSRSDSMILCTFNKKARTLTMTSFLRDLYVDIPGYHANRINAAYAAGGMPLLTETLAQNFGLHIDGSVEVDFAQFSEIIDLLGGVEIELRQDEADVINYETGSDLGAGPQVLTGYQALTYARIRKLDADGDFSRTSRQRKVLGALMRAYKGSGLTTTLTLLNKVLPMVTTDMSNMEILMYAVELFPILSNAQIISQHVPAEGTYTDQNIDGMSVLVADKAAVRKMLEQTLLGG